MQKEYEFNIYYQKLGDPEGTLAIKDWVTSNELQQLKNLMTSKEPKQCID